MNRDCWTMDGVDFCRLLEISRSPEDDEGDFVDWRKLRVHIVRTCLFVPQLVLVMMLNLRRRDCHHFFDDCLDEFVDCPALLANCRDV